MTRWLMVVALVGGCSLRKLSLDATTRLLHDGSRAMESEPDVELARVAIPGQLKTVEGLLLSAPRNRTLLEMSARASLQFGFGFLEDDVESARESGARQIAVGRATAMYDRAFGWALQLLALDEPDIRAAFDEGGARWDAALARLSREAVPGLAYGGMALASAAGLNRADPARLAKLPRARAMLARSHALDPRFDHGAAVMTLGILAAQLGDRAAAERQLREAIELAGSDYLLPRVMSARLLLTGKERDEALEAILAIPPDISTRNRLANEIARRRAAHSLRK